MSDQIDISSEDVTVVSDEVDFKNSRSPRIAKGPDPEEWGDPESRREADIEAGKFTQADLVNEAIQEKLASGEDPIVEVDGRTIKGPDPVKWDTT